MHNDKPHITVTGDAIICNEVVRKGGVRALQALAEIGRPATVPEIARHLGEPSLVQSLYNTLTRIRKKQKLVVNEKIVLCVAGGNFSRVVWSLKPEAVEFFTSLHSAHPKSS